MHGTSRSQKEKKKKKADARDFVIHRMNRDTVAEDKESKRIFTVEQ